MSPLYNADGEKMPKVPVPSHKWQMPFFRRSSTIMTGDSRRQDVDESARTRIPKWSMGIMNDPTTIEVPGQLSLIA